MLFALPSDYSFTIIVVHHYMFAAREVRIYAGSKEIRNHLKLGVLRFLVTENLKLNQLITINNTYEITRITET